MLVAYCQAMHTQVLKIEALSSLYVIGIILGYPIIITVSLVAHIFQLLVKFVKSRFGHSKSIAGEVALVTGAGHGLGRDIAIALAQQGCHIAVVGTQVKYLLETSAFIAQTFGVKTKAYKVTGGGHGLGRNIAIALAQQGCHIAVVGTQENFLKDTAAHIAKEYGVKTKYYKVDVTNYQQICELKENVSKDLGDVTILINNAGVIYMSTKEKPSAEVVQRMINVNLTGTTLVTDVFLPKMKELNRGHIVNVSSASVFFPLPIHYIYGSTKAAMRYLTAALRVHLRQIKSNVKATCLMPSYLTTNKGVSEDMKATGITPGQFQIDGDVLAQYVIKALHWGHEEIAVPCGFLWVQKLSAIFPAYIQEFSLTLLSRTLKK